MMTFRDYMESVLYDPRSGYYAAHRRVRQDFFTAPEVHDCFGTVLADDFASRLERLRAEGVPGPFCIVEMGAGDGRLAAAVLRRFHARHPESARSLEYVVVERASRFLGEALEALAAFPRVRGCADLEQVPAAAGVFFSNELVDAFPFHLLEKRAGKVQEVLVAPSADGSGVRVGWSEPSRPELAEAASRIEPGMEEGQRHAVNLESGRWLRALAGKLKAGWVITIDYGRRYREGSVVSPRVFYRHRLEDFPARPGREDITASVDFEGLIREGEAVELAMEEYQTMSRFLLDRGILGLLPEGSSVEAQLERVRIKNLFHPEGMGESFKVLVQRRLGASA